MKASQKTPILIASGVVAALAVALTGAVVFAKKGKGDAAAKVKAFLDKIPGIKKLTAN